MARAVVTIPQVEGEARKSCTSCKGELADSALKCKNCNEYTHLSCSSVPKYMLIRFSIAQASYICPSCVKIKDLGGDEEKYSEEATKIAEIIAKESSLVSKAAELANKSNSEIPDNNATGESNANNVEPTNANPLPVCKYYLQKGCKHGKKGSGCNYSHPKLCFSYIKRGEKSGGCKKGDQCNYVHPKLCRRALDSRVCTNERCRFYHVTGTRFTRPADVEIRGSPARQETQPVPKKMLQRPTQHRNAPQDRNDTGNHSQNVRDENSHDITRGNEPPVPQEYFLEMKQQIRSMQDQMMLLVSILKPQAPQLNSTPQTSWGSR